MGSFHLDLKVKDPKWNKDDKYYALSPDHYFSLKDQRKVRAEAIVFIFPALLRANKGNEPQFKDKDNCGWLISLALSMLDHGHILATLKAAVHRKRRVNSYCR